MPNDLTGFQEVLRDEESLAIFVRGMSKLDKRFCEHMVAGDDFTLRLEIHGNKGCLVHCRVQSDGFERPKKVERDIERKKRLR